MPMMTPRSNPYAYIEDGHMYVDGLGQLSMTTPSGHTVELTEGDERAIARQVLEERLIGEMTRADRRKEAVMEAGIGAVGNAIGFAIGGYLVGKLLGGKV